MLTTIIFYKCWAGWWPPPARCWAGWWAAAECWTGWKPEFVGKADGRAWPWRATSASALALPHVTWLLVGLTLIYCFCLSTPSLLKRAKMIWSFIWDWFVYTGPLTWFSIFIGSQYPKLGMEEYPKQSCLRQQFILALLSYRILSSIIHNISLINLGHS